MYFCGVYCRYKPKEKNGEVVNQKAKSLSTFVSGVLLEVQDLVFLGVGWILRTEPTGRRGQSQWRKEKKETYTVCQYSVLYHM